ncbi:hypothetical protein HanIR_Chr01g0031061 [Helianthus annuus]|nr:hypothetical protein HanIR_Chr01g0031061 [Helianthus annuus]
MSTPLSNSPLALNHKGWFHPNHFFKRKMYDWLENSRAHYTPLSLLFPPLPYKR